MKITQDVREYAKAKGIGDLEQALETGMKEKAEQFRNKGGKIYTPE